ncbi:MAG TPA: TerC family protein, partial [Armatimonadota bacterium]
LIFTGLRLAVRGSAETHPEKNPMIRLLSRRLPVSRNLEGGRFFTRVDGRILATPLFLVLLVVETTDLFFAVDSIPAILAISQDPFIVYTSNVFAILGLRALYFALAGIVPHFRFLHIGLAAILVFVGIKMLLLDVYKVPIALALGVVGAILLLSIVASRLFPGTENLASE